MPECQYCKTILSDKASLNNHQRRSKYCLKLRNPDAAEVEPDMFECEFCKKELTSKYRLKSHLVICKMKKKKETEETDIIEELRREINQLKEKQTSTTTIINNTDNSIKTINQHNYSSILDCTTESVTETLLKHFKTIQHLLESDQKHLANITVEHILSGKNQPMYYVSDRSRNKFMFTDRENNEKEDANAILLRRLVYKGLKPIISNLYEKQRLKLNDDLSRYLRKEDGALVSYTREEIKELEESYENANILKEGDDYISQLSKCLPTSIKDRIYHDSIGLEDDDEEELAFQERLRKKMRMIGNYTANELKDYKRQFKENREVYLPKEIVSDPKQYREVMAFLQEADD